jgi:hypothetical protein
LALRGSARSLGTKSKRASTSSGPSRASSSGLPALLALLALGGAASWGFWLQGSTLAYGDAEAHLNIARRITDSRAPGYEQIGTVWLPLPHAAMLPLAMHDWLWRSGVAGAIAGGIVYGLGGWLFYLATRRMFGAAAAAAGTAAWALNPNLLYLQAAPMTEPYSLASMALAAYLVTRFRESQSGWAAAGAGVALTLGALTRYESWFLIPVAGLAVLLMGGKGRWRKAAVFGLCASCGPLYWLAHNQYFYSDALEFYRGPWSAMAINRGSSYPGFHDWPVALKYYRAAAEGCLGAPLAWIGAAGLVAALWKRQWGVALLLFAVPVFYVTSLHSSGTPIFVPNLWPNSWYNTRYGLGALPAAAFGVAALAAAMHERARRVWSGVLVAACLSPWILYPRMDNWLCWKEAQVNGAGRRAWTREAAAYLAPRYRQGDGILLSFGDPAGVLRESGIRIAESLHEGDGPMFQAALARPDLFVWEEWAISVEGDRVSKAMERLKRGSRRYERVRVFTAPHSPVVEIWRHITGKDPR